MWQEENNKLYRKFQFKNFSEAFAFMTRVALVAEKMDHHPLWTNVYNTLEVWLSTHDAGDIVTDKDRQLAKKNRCADGMKEQNHASSNTSYYWVTNFNPMMDAMSVVRKKSLQKSAGSLNTKMPTKTVPTAPMPVHTA